MSSAFEDRDGREWSFVDALEALIPDLRAFAYSLCRDRTLAEDLAQTACLKAWAASDRFRPGSPMKPWLFRILRNEYLQHARRSWRMQTTEPSVIDDLMGTEDALGSIAELSQVAAAIYALPNDQRDALILILAAGLSYEEAAEVLDCPTGTLKSRVSRAREALLRDLEAGPDGPDLIVRRSPLSLQTLIDHAEQLIKNNGEAA